MSFTSAYGQISPKLEDDFSDSELIEILPENDEDPVFIGNKKTKVFHRPDCFCVKQIRTSNKVGLDLDLKDEKDRVYRACCKCFPNSAEVESLEEQANLEDF